MTIRKSYWNYIPIIICIFLGYIIGGYLAFGVKFLNALPFITDRTGRFTLILFGMGMLGSTTYCIRFWGLDVEETVYSRQDLFPHFYDFVGYLGAIVGGGVSGVVLYLIVKTGIIVSVSPGGIPDVNFSVSIIIAYCGGLFHFRVQNILSSFISKILKHKDDDKKGQLPFSEECKPRDPMVKSSMEMDKKANKNADGSVSSANG
jgi:hypothetical protein